MSRALLFAPSSAKRGEVIEVRALVQHPMDTGYRRSNDGEPIARNLVRTITCRIAPLAGAAAQTQAQTQGAAGGEIIFSARLHAAVAANPYLAFHCRMVVSSRLTVQWAGDNGFTNSASADVLVL